MSKLTLALLGFAVLVSVGHWLSMRAAVHVDMHLLPDHSRRRVQWLMVNSMHVQLGCAAVAAAAVAAQLVTALG